MPMRINRFFQAPLAASRVSVTNGSRAAKVDVRGTVKELIEKNGAKVEWVRVGREERQVGGEDLPFRTITARLQTKESEGPFNANGYYWPSKGTISWELSGSFLGDIFKVFGGLIGA
jgi:hypothetical protein